MTSAEGYTRALASPTIASRWRALSVSGSATARTLTLGSTLCIEAIIAAARCPSPITASLVTQTPPTPDAAYPLRLGRERSPGAASIVSELLPGGFESAVHDHHDREAVFVGAILVYGVAIGQPAHNPFALQRRVVSVALPQRDDGQQFVEDFGQLGHGRLLLLLVETRGSLDDHLLQVHLPERLRLLRHIVRDTAARGVHVIRQQWILEGIDRMRLSLAPRLDAHLELAVLYPW